MNKDPWLEQGLEELQQGHWFDGFQMLTGAIQRAFRYNDPNRAQLVISKAVPLFAAGNHEKLACDLVASIATNLRRRIDNSSLVELIPSVFVILLEVPLEKCVQTICNQIIVEKAFQDSKFLFHLHNLILESNFNDVVISNLYFCYAGLLCYKKDFVACFEALHTWSKELPSLSPKMRTYLTLAEINAYEIEGCGKYLHLEEPVSSSVHPPESESYLDIANRILSAVQTSDNSEFYSTLSDYSDLIDPKNDGLLKALCDGISEIFNNKSKPGLFSLFGK